MKYDIHKTFDQNMEDHRREVLADLLSQCTEDQRAGLHRIYRKMPMLEKDLNAVIQLMHRTVLLNVKAQLAKGG